VATFFTPLLLHDAFVWQDQRRFISYRRFVAPSFNDIRLILNTAQVMSLIRGGPLELATFDGDVTLYDDGKSLTEDNPVIPRILRLIRNGTRIGIVTAAGYTEARRYYERLHGLLDALNVSEIPTALKHNLIVMGGESNFCFRFADDSPDLLKFVPRKDWLLDEMLLWEEADITELISRNLRKPDWSRNNNACEDTDARSRSIKIARLSEDQQSEEVGGSTQSR